MLDHFSNQPTNRSNRFLWLFLALFFALSLSNLVGPYMTNIFNGLLSGIAPVLIAIVIAFICYRLVDLIEKVFLKKAFKNSKHKHAFKRAISLTIVTILIFGFLCLVGYIVIPKVIEVIKELIGNESQYYIDKVTIEIQDVIKNWFGAEVEINIQSLIDTITTYINTTLGSLKDLLQLSSTVVSGLFAVVTGLIFAVLMLKDKEKISGFFRRYTYANFKREKADEICVITRKSNDILFDYFISKIIEFAILFAATGLLYMLLETQYAWELAFIVALFNFIPYFGVIIGLVPAVLIITVFNSLTLALYVVLYTALLFVFVTTFITPFITGAKIKVSGLLVGASILVGGSMFGIAGMLFAPPVVSIVSIVVNEGIEVKENRIKYLRELKEEHDRQLQLEQERRFTVENDADDEETVEARGMSDVVEEVSQDAKKAVKKTTTKTKTLDGEKKTTKTTTKRTTTKKVEKIDKE